MKTGPSRRGTLESFTSKTGTRGWRGRIRLGDGSRLRIPVPDGMSEARARAYVEAWQQKEDDEGKLLARKRAAEGKAVDGGESCNAWHARYLAGKTCGERHRRITENAWAKWISPHLGHLAIATLTRDVVENVRDALDAAVAEGRLAAKSAQNVWSGLTTPLKAAAASKDRTLRVHSAPIHTGILPPDAGSSAVRPWLYPREFSALWSCAAIPLERRFLYACAAFLGLRPGELRALRWGDVDHATKLVTVARAWDEGTSTTKPPKTKAGLREVPIHDHLLPLLALHRRGPHELVVHVADWGEVASTFRADLRAAGITRERLYVATSTEMAIDFRALCTTPATWCALDGVPLGGLRRRLGHEKLDQADGYCRVAESFTVEGVGRPFPQLVVHQLAPANDNTSDSHGNPEDGAGTPPAQALVTTSLSDESCTSSPDEATPTDTQVHEVTSVGRANGPTVEAELARALRIATDRGEWPTVAEIARALVVLRG